MKWKGDDDESEDLNKEAEELFLYERFVYI